MHTYINLCLTAEFTGDPKCKIAVGLYIFLHDCFCWEGRFYTAGVIPSMLLMALGAYELLKETCKAAGSASFHSCLCGRAAQRLCRVKADTCPCREELKKALRN